VQRKSLGDGALLQGRQACNRDGDGERIAGDTSILGAGVRDQDFDTGGSGVPVRSGGSRSPSRIGAELGVPRALKGVGDGVTGRVRAGVRVLAGGAGDIEQARSDPLPGGVFWRSTD